MDKIFKNQGTLIYYINQNKKIKHKFMSYKLKDKFMSHFESKLNLNEGVFYLNDKEVEEFIKKTEYGKHN